MAFDSPDVQQDPGSPTGLAGLATNPALGQPQPSAAPAPSAQDSQPAPAVTPQGPHWTQPAPDPNFSEKFGAGMVSTLSDPRIASQPGAWAKSVLLNSVHAMAPGSFGAKLAAAINPVMNSLGDAATGQRSVAGAIGQTLANRQKRIAGQNQQDFQNDQEAQKNQALIAESNVRMLHEQMLTHQLGDQAIDQAIESGKKGLALMQSGHIPGQVLGEDLTSDQLQTMIANKHLDPTKETAFATGRKQVGEDANGLPIMRTTYTAVGIPEGDADPLSKEDAAFLSKYTHTEIKEGQVLPAAQLNNIWQTASDSQAATQARNRELEDKEIADSKHAKDLEAVRIGPEWQNALIHSGNDALRALDAMQANPDIVKKYPNLYDDVRTAYGPPNFDALIKSREKKIENQTDYLQKLEDDPSQMSGEKAASAAVMLQSRLTDPTTPAELKPRIQRLINQANSAQTASESYEASKERSKQAITDGDPRAGAQLLVDRVVAPSQLVSTRKPQYATEAYRIAKEMDPSFDAGIYEAQFKVAGNPNQAQFFGSANSLLDQGGTLNQLAANYSKLPNGKIPKLNSLADWTSAATGQGVMAGFAATALGVADDYAKVMGGGVGSDSSRMQALDLIKAASSPKDMQAAIDSIRGAVTSQTNSRMGKNPYLRKMYGADLPQAQQTQNQNTQNSQQTRQTQQPTPAPNTHVFDPNAWQQAHPGQDVNAAIAYAKSKGFQVKQ